MTLAQNWWCEFLEYNELRKLCPPASIILVCIFSSLREGCHIIVSLKTPFEFPQIMLCIPCHYNVIYAIPKQHGMGATEPISYVPLFSLIYQNYENTIWILNITFIFDRCRRS